MSTTIGIKLYHGAEVTDKSSWNAAQVGTGDIQIPGVQNIPTIQGAPTPIDITSIEDDEEQSEPGLIGGSSIGVVMNYKITALTGGVESASNFIDCLAISNDKIYPFKLLFPSGRWFAFLAKATTTLADVPVAAALQFDLTLFKQSKVFTGITVTP